MKNEQSVQDLRRIQANGTVFYQKLRNFHWHVKGPQFFALHGKLEELYEQWAEVVDEIAEEVVIDGDAALATLAQVLEQATLREEPGSPEAGEMIRRVVTDLESLVADVDMAAQRAEGRAANLLESIRDEQQKVLWMWRSLLEE